MRYETVKYEITSDEFDETYAFFVVNVPGHSQLAKQYVDFLQEIGMIPRVTTLVFTVTRENGENN